MILRNIIVLAAFLSSTLSMAEIEGDPSELALEIENSPNEEGSRKKIWKTSARPDYKPAAANQAIAIETSSSFRMKTTGSSFGGIETHTFREKFSVSNNESNSTVGLAMEILYQKMAERCPGGWKKTHEWVEVSLGNFYLNYEISCT